MSAALAFVATILVLTSTLRISPRESSLVWNESAEQHGFDAGAHIVTVSHTVGILGLLCIAILLSLIIYSIVRAML